MFGIGFDFDHTLGLDNRLERTALLNVLGREAAAAGKDQTLWGDMVDAALHEYRSGRHSLHVALEVLFENVCGTKCNRAVLFERFSEETIALAPSHIEAITGARELLARLAAAGVPTAILTNGWNPLQQRKADLIGYEGAVIVSDDIEIRKPDGRAFDILAAALELPPSQIIYVGDSPEADIVGALNAGMQAVWFNWEKKTYDERLPKPSAVIYSLDEVDDLVFAAKK